MKFIITFLLVFVNFVFGFGQAIKKPLTHDLYDSWKSLNGETICNNGTFVAYEVNPQKGNGKLFLWNSSINKTDSFARGYKATFSPNSDFLIFKIKPTEEETRKAKKDKKKKDELPKDSLKILFLNKDTSLAFANVKSFSIPKENPNYIAVYFEKEIKKAKKDTIITNDTITKTIKKNSDKKDKSSKDKKKELSNLLLLNTKTFDTLIFKNISEYYVSKNGGIVAVIQMSTDTIDSSFVKIFDTKSKKVINVFSELGVAKYLTCNNSQLAFLHSTDTCENKSFILKFWTLKSNKVITVCNSTTSSIPKGWLPSENYSMFFSDDESKLFFGTAPKPVNNKKDTLLDDEKCNLDIWSWNDEQIQPQQLKNLDKEKKRTYLAVYHTQTNNIVQIADTIFKTATTPFHGNGNYSIAMSQKGYEQMSSWDFPVYKDYSLINLITGEKKHIAKKVKYNIMLSPSEKYLFWFDYADSAWYSQPINEKKSICLTCNLKFPFYNEDDDTPNPPDAYGYMGWTENDENFLAYDRYDIWKLNPLNKEKPSIIISGRMFKTQYRYEKTNNEINFIPKNENILLHCFKENNKHEGYFLLNIKSNNIKLLTEAGNNYNFSVKAQKSDSYIWTQSTYNMYPDLRFTKNNFKNINIVSNVNPQQNEYLWGNVELIKWRAFDGKELEGLLYKPENFDSTKTYPMITYFYELNSNEIFRHYSVKPSRSVINFTFYTSNGYIIFVPDVKYGKGHPGNDAYNCIISGVKELSKNNWIDKNHLGLQGQSWGGYQVAYLITRTDTMFAAAMAGAPVSNMTSAYGGIRWESGQGRMFQYEKGQSRIGYNIWDSLSLYIENSPIFGANKIKTPLLIMANDGDGAVPWYQGIEFYMALRRLEKPAWLLNYNGDEHNLSKRPNMLDLSIRMKDFFDHYLKDSPAPEWMEKGRDAINNK